MRVDVRGDSSVMSTFEWRKVVSWYGEHLLGRRMADRCSVFLELSPYIRGVAGSISCTDWRRKRDFLVQIETRCGIRKQLYTLGHEMTHLRQIVRGELVVHHGDVIWRSDRHAGVEEPWEVEAYANERTLYRLFRTR